jgi:hypothetical protein
VALAARDRHEAAASERVVHVELLVAGLRSPAVSGHPHLDEVDGRVGLGFISLWRMPVPADIRCASPR